MRQTKYTFLVKTEKREFILEWVEDEPFEDKEFRGWVYDLVYEETIGKMMDERDCGIDDIPYVLNLSEEVFQRIREGKYWEEE